MEHFDNDGDLRLFSSGEKMLTERGCGAVRLRRRPEGDSRVARQDDVPRDEWRDARIRFRVE